ncbi:MULTISPECIES: acyl-CoA dehydratase activase [Carboxydothermus]|uniref:CoA-substrate-specific enzyme activase n=2 Tax=Carboxydothermus TaxID=129957 RepID=A0ABX2RCC0_9THEO|nr:MULTISPECIES: acyl-CoA dehydratase activase [Carboxydothermus]ABB13715.1 putative CoA-substrate-specific enzyme activase [Carboxydothermus hydrogenoformans Z-2901]NYE58665.1 putative CoA-substrate-specific enzyme activase [Carboxydothermus ferrireducens DSM 11255]
MKKGVFLGIDVGSVSTNLVVINEEKEILEAIYLRTNGRPLVALKEGLRKIYDRIKEEEILGVGTTGSGRQLAALVLGADTVKNEITAHAVAANYLVPGVRTILEIGGQDSKLILLKDGVVTDFAMNTVCAAGTGSFLDQQAQRLNIPIEKFGEIALKAQNPVRIAGRCAVFAESDMIHKQQLGLSIEDILAGLCDALVRNYLNNLAKGKKLYDKIVFQGGVAANIAMREAFRRALCTEVIVPPYFEVMGALGAALIAAFEREKQPYKTRFKGFNVKDAELKTENFECQNCPNFCEVVKIYEDYEVVGYLNDRCGRYSQMNNKKLAGIG